MTRYYSTQKRGQTTVADKFTIIDTDPSVKNFFEPTPEGYVKAYTDEGLPYNELISIYVAPEKTIQQQIDDLENSVTKRNYREFVLGNQKSIDKISKVEADIELLRAEL
ncbi:MAG: hypothetical protein JKY50_00865 [Oleispira sp.]|nr:hypothetical protein [Oleispira sp.]